MTSLTTPIDAHSCKKGTYVMLKGCPCKIVDVKVSKTGKHGHAKCNITGIDCLTGKKCNEVHPGHIVLGGFDLQRRELEVTDIDESDAIIRFMNEDNEEEVFDFDSGSDVHNQLNKFWKEESEKDDPGILWATVVKAPRGETGSLKWDEAIMEAKVKKEE